MANTEGLKCGTTIRVCTCEHEYQDKKYGNKIRVHNACGSGGYSCSVCGNKKTT